MLNTRPARLVKCNFSLTEIWMWKTTLRSKRPRDKSSGEHLWLIKELCLTWLVWSCSVMDEVTSIRVRTASNLRVRSRRRTMDDPGWRQGRCSASMKTQIIRVWFSDTRKRRANNFAPSTMRPLCFEQHNRRLVRSLLVFFLVFFILIWSHNLSTDSIGSGSEMLQPRSPSASSCLLLLLASGTAERTECRSESFALTYSRVNTGLELNR